MNPIYNPKYNFNLPEGRLCSVVKWSIQIGS